LRTFKVRTFASVATALAVAVALSIVMSESIAQAQVVPTKGNAPKASGGQAWTRLIADLNKFPAPGTGQTGCGSAYKGYVVCASDYDDDPGSSGNFVGSPNLGDDPIQHAWKVLYFDFHEQSCLEEEAATCPASNDIAAIQKEIFWVDPDESQTGGGIDQNENGQRVLHEVVEARTGNLVNPDVIITGTACNTIGTPGGPSNSIADGLVATGQVEASELTDMIAKCIQNEGGFHLNNWTISKHLPPGTYAQCITLMHTNGAQTDAVCRDFTILPLDGYVIDFANSGVAWAGLRLGNKSVHSGDFDLDTPQYPTIQGEGNTSLVYGVRYQTLTNEIGKRIWSDFDGQINRKDNAGSPPRIVEWEYIDGVSALLPNDSASWTDWIDFEGANLVLGEGVANGSGAVCLEPNEPLKLDFSVTPEQTVWAGVYSGSLEIRAVPDQTVCTASLDSGENTTGDTNGVFNNNPSQGGPGGPFHLGGPFNYGQPGWQNP
jgi:hypothetical protein